MFERELMITGIEKQRGLLNEVQKQLTRKSNLNETDCQLYQETLKKVESNLRKLRQLRRGCLECQPQEG